MTYLQLCQRLRQESGIAGNGPTSVLSQTGQLARLVGWVSQAWTDIQQSRPNWLFMHSDFTFDTVAGTRDYLASDYSIDDLKLWDRNSFFLYETLVGESDENPIPFKSYSGWREQYRNQMNVQHDDRPTMFTILQDNKVRFQARPNKVYTINGEYKRTTQAFVADADVPTNLPADFHLIIVWAALKYFASFEDAPEIMDEAEMHYDDLLFRLEQEQLPMFSEDYPALA